MERNTVSRAGTPDASFALVVALFGLTFVTGVIDTVTCLAAGAALIAGGETSSARLYLVIVLTAMAMGLRKAVVRKLGVSDVTTTGLPLDGHRPCGRLGTGRWC